jgi:hypothetical protein
MYRNIPEVCSKRPTNNQVLTVSILIAQQRDLIGIEQIRQGLPPSKTRTTGGVPSNG